MISNIETRQPEHAKMLKFFYNGIKDNGGKLQKCWYSKGAYINLPEDTITIYAKGYTGLSKGIREAFNVENNSDGMTDYFETDRIRVFPSHPLYAEVHAALLKCNAHGAKRAERWAAKHAA